jgi:diguanylate cyclase (GGDEF)-like protein
LRNSGLLSEIEHLATRDGLTGLANRRLFEESLQREVARSHRRKAPLALVVLDVDHFKHVNDTVGHQAGDAVLREVARAMVGNTKASDLPARYGGDEFVVLLPDCTGDDALAVAERLRAAVARDVTAVPVTVSAGVERCPGTPATVSDWWRRRTPLSTPPSVRVGTGRWARTGSQSRARRPTTLRCDGAPARRKARRAAADRTLCRGAPDG